MKIKQLIVINLLYLLLFFSLNCSLEKRIINIPVADLLNTTVGRYPSKSKKILTAEDNKHKLSQAVFGEQILVKKELSVSNNGKKQEKWLQIKTPEQKINVLGFRLLLGEYSKCYVKKCQTFPVADFPANNLVVKAQWTYLPLRYNKKNIKFPICIGTMLKGKKINDKFYEITLPNGEKTKIKSKYIYQISPTVQETTQQLRQNLIETAKTFLGSPYCWGGRSAYNSKFKKQQTSTDCSGFINLVYRANGLQIPKNSRSQYKSGKKISGKNMRAGDLIFLAKPEESKKIIHVMMYLGDNQIIEATIEDHAKVRIISDIKRLGKKISEIKNKEKSEKYIIYFSSFLSSNKKIQKLRTNALKT